MTVELQLARARRNARQAVRDFVEGARTGDLERMVNSFDGLDDGCVDGGGWSAAMRRVAKLDSVPLVTQKIFLAIYVRDGDHIRQECGDDLVLIRGLRVLLPKYEGPSLLLFRGEGFRNRCRRTYGLSWSASEAVARQHACGLWQQGQGGSVLLEAHASADAIICAPALLNDRYGESEYIVDRRRLTDVRVIERFSRRDLAD